VLIKNKHAVVSIELMIYILHVILIRFGEDG